jgi:hypothetical protein
MLVNCIFSGNSAGYGGGMFNRRSSLINVVNCTFSLNSATYSGEGGGIYNRDCNPIITNCIIWANVGEQIFNYNGTANANVTYSCVQGGYIGAGNISSNPMFAGYDLRIKSGSFCIDAGDNDALPPDTYDLDEDANTSEPIPFDLGGGARRADDPGIYPDKGNGGILGAPVVDMGAYEQCCTYSYSLRRNTLDGGGGSSCKGPYLLIATIGQPDAGHSIGGPYELFAGFWAPELPCFVDLKDFAHLAQYWLASGAHLPADLHEDNIIDLIDLNRFVNQWLYLCPYGWPLKK